MSAAAIIDGKEKARQLSLTIKDSTAQLKKDGIVPGLAVIIIGEDPASQVYVRNKKRTAEECGFYSVQHKLEESISEKEILDLIALLNQDDSIHGILVQLPLPKNLNEELITQSIAVSYTHLTLPTILLV